MSTTNTKKAHSAAWLGQSYDRLSAYETRTPEYVMHMASIRRGIANFVRIVTGKDIPVHFSTGKQSFASKDRVVISASDDPNQIDTTVGLALHEGAHILLSQPTHAAGSIPLYDFLTKFHATPQMFISPTLANHATRLVGNVIDDIQLLINVLEDRRIDQWMYRNAPGYRPYYEAMYTEMWHSEVIDRALKSPLTTRPTLQHYRLHIVNMTNANAYPTALPGLATIWQLVDLPNIDRFGRDPRWKTWEAAMGYHNATSQINLSFLPEMIQVALQIAEIMYSNALLPHEVEDTDDMIRRLQDEKAAEKAAQKEKTTPQSPAQSIPMVGGGDGEEMPTDDKQTNFDMPTSSDSDIGDSEDAQTTTLKTSQKKVRRPYNESRLTKAMEQQRQFVKGTYKREKLSEGAARDVDALESADTTLTKVGTDFKAPATAITFRRVTEQLLRSQLFPFSRTSGGHPISSQEVRDAVKTGELMGNLLAHRLRIMADDHPLTFTRQPHGRLDRRLVAGLGYDMENVFSHVVVERRAPILLHLSLDASSSMIGVKWAQAITVATALARAAEKVANLNVVISLRGGVRGHIHIATVYDSRVDRFIKARTIFPLLYPCGSTPEGLAFEAMKDEFLAGDATTRRYFVNISDGEPAMRWSGVVRGNKFKRVKGQMVSVEAAITQSQYYGGDAAYAHTAKQMRAYREAGTRILSYFVADRPIYSSEYYTKRRDEIVTAFRQMYGPAAEFIDVSQMTDIVRTLNKLFLSE